MKKMLILLALLTITGCVSTPQTETGKMSARERESILLMEMDRTKKQDKARLDRLVSQAGKGGVDFMTRQEQEARSQSIRLYRELISSFPENRGDYMAEASFRLAELLFESERDRIRILLETEGEEADLIPDFSEAISAYNQVIDKFPGHPLTEDALYGLSYCYTEQGNLDLAADGYTRLFNSFPKTRYAVEINMRLGEYHFTMENLQQAIVHYDYVISEGDPDYVEKALYKLGWCYYNLDDYDSAIGQFFTLLDEDIKRGGSPESLVEESMDIIARSFSESGGTPGLVKTLNKRGYNRYSSAILLKLANLYKERSFYPEAIGTYRTYMDKFPNGAELPEALENMRESYFIRGDTLAALLISETLTDHVGPDSTWYQDADTDRQQEVMGRILNSLETAAGRRRARSQTGGKEAELTLALGDLDQYRALSGEETPCRIDHLRSLVMAELDMFPQSPQAYNLLAAREDCPDWTQRASLESVVFQINLYDDSEIYDLELLKSSVATLEKTAPEDPTTPKAVLALGEITLNAEDLPAARSHFSRIIRTYPKAQEAGRARMLIARTFFKEDDFKQASAWFREAWKRNTDAEEGAEAKRLHVYSLFKYAEELSEAGQITEAAERFESIYKQFPESDVAQVSLYNSGKLYRDIGLERRATALFEELAFAYRESDLATEALQMSVLILEALGDPLKAAEDSLALADRSEGEDRAAALLKAADLFSSAQGHTRAAAARRIYLNEYKEPADEFGRQTYLLGRDFEAYKDWRNALAAYQDVVKQQENNTDSEVLGGYAARSQLRIAEESFSRYQKVRITPPVEETVVAKRTLLQEVIRNFVSAGKYKVADVITASNFFIGRSLEIFKDDILTSPRPEGLTEVQLEEYNLLLDEMAFPFEEKALNAYRVNIQRAVKLELLDEWIEKSYERMAQLAPWAYEREEAFSYPSTLLQPPAINPPLPSELNLRQEEANAAQVSDEGGS
jgi:TolA-binding protein